jgi:hypothetical protein
VGLTDESHIFNKTGWTVEWLGYMKVNLFLHMGPPPATMVKVKEYWNRPGVAQRVPGGLGSQIS